MGRHSPSLKRYMLLSALALFTSSAIAQTTTAAATGDDATTTAAATTTAQTTAATTAATTATTATDDDTTTDDSGTTVPALSDTTTTAAGTTAATTGTDPTDLPTLSSTGSVTGYPSPSVPPTSNAPYMQTSNLPEGTVFIAVGAILGAFGAAILIWRAVVACLLHRSVKRAALAQHMANDKMAVPGAPPAPFYKYTDHESQGSLGAATAAAGRGVRRTTRGPVPSATPSQTNLFFSPTAGATGSAGNRSSTFLPSGFYAAGQGAPPSGHGHAISMTDLRPDSRESPGVTPRNDPIRRHPQMSTSTLNLNQAATGRAPSMYLDDLLDDNPQQFPPPGGNHGWGQSRDRL